MRHSYLPPYGHACCPHCTIEFDLVDAVPTVLEKAPHNDTIIYMMHPECHAAYQAGDGAKRKSMTGRFNAVLERNFIVCMDEAMFAGDRRAIDRLKSTVTEPLIQIEQKYQPSRSIDSVHRFFAASNHEHFANIERDDRRFLFLRISAARKQDTAYFGAVTAAIKDQNTLNALVYYLLRKDLSRYNVRVKPETGEQMTQKLRSLQGFERFWYEVLTSGNLDGTLLLSEPWTADVFVSTSRLMSSYREFDKNSERHQTLQEAQVAETIRRICPSAQKRRGTVGPHDRHSQGQRRGFHLPAIKTARDEFSAYLGCELDWDEGDDSEPD